MNTKFLTMWFDETKKGRSYSLRYHKKQAFGYFQTKEFEFKIFMIPVYFDDHWMLIIVDLDSMQMYWCDSLPQKVLVNRKWKGAQDPKILGEKFMNYVKMFFLERCGVPQSCSDFI